MRWGIVMYRIGFPGWRVAARLGVPMFFRVHVHHDKAAGSYWATSPDVQGLTVSGTDLDELAREVNGAACELIALQLDSSKPIAAHPEMRWRSGADCFA